MLRERIKQETISAMKGGAKERTAALRLISAKIKDRDIEQRTAAAPMEDDALVIDTLLKMAKQRRESIQMFDEAGRDELAAQERAELGVIEEFLPQQMSEDQTRAAIASPICAVDRAAPALRAAMSSMTAFSTRAAASG